MELDTVDLRHWRAGRTYGHGAFSYVSVPIVPDRDAKVFYAAGYVASATVAENNLKSHNDLFDPTKTGASGYFLLKEYLPYLDVDYCVSAYWFHSSRLNADNFYHDGHAMETLHVGALTAALERRTVIEEGPTPRPYLHVFKLRSPRALQKTWVEDDGEPKAYSPHKVSRYINRYECPGSVSLVGHIKNFEMVDTIRVDVDASVITFDALPDELKERIQPYVQYPV